MQAPKAGLQFSKKPTKKPLGKPFGLFSKGMGSKPAPRKVPGKTLSIFASALEDDENDMEDARARANRQVLAQQKSKAKKMESARVKALEEDASVFEYDSVYDNIQDERAEKVEDHRKQKARRESRYIKELLKKGEEREREQGIINERVLRREREKDDHLYGDKEKFVTTGYKEKLIEDRKWEAQEAIRVAKERDVTKGGTMANFSAHLLNSGMSRSNTGGLTKKKEEAAARGEEEKAVRLRLEAQEREDEERKAKVAEEWEQKRAKRAAEHQKQRVEDLVKKEMEKKTEGTSAAAEVVTAAIAEADKEDSAEPAAKKAKTEPAPTKRTKPAEAPRTKEVVETKTLSARERYLARKKAASS